MFPTAEADAVIERTRDVVAADIAARMVARAYVSVEPATPEWSNTLAQLAAAMERLDAAIVAANAAMRAFDAAAASAAASLN